MFCRTNFRRSDLRSFQTFYAKSDLEFLHTSVGLGRLKCFWMILSGAYYKLEKNWISNLKYKFWKLSRVQRLIFKRDILWIVIKMLFSVLFLHVILSACLFAYLFCLPVCLSVCFACLSPFTDFSTLKTISF